MRPETQRLVDELEAFDTPELEVYSEGICMASVCSSLSREEVVARMATRPTGTSGSWSLSADAFRDGKPNGGPCEETPGRHHWLFEC